MLTQCHRSENLSSTSISCIQLANRYLVRVWRLAVWPVQSICLGMLFHGKNKNRIRITVISYQFEDEKALKNKEQISQNTELLLLDVDKQTSTQISYSICISSESIWNSFVFKWHWMNVKCVLIQRQTICDVGILNSLAFFLMQIKNIPLRVWTQKVTQNVIHWKCLGDSVWVTSAKQSWLLLLIRECDKNGNGKQQN